MFTVQHDTPLTPDEAWARITNWPAHGAFVPLTRVRVTPSGPTSVGSVLTAHTGLGRPGFDDVMEVVRWEPPRFCRLEKRGRVIKGWAEIEIEPRDSGCRVTWREEAVPVHLPRFALRMNDAAGRRLFGRVVRGLLTK